MSTPFKLTKKEINALRWLRDNLRRGTIKHTPSFQGWTRGLRIKTRLSFTRYFNMGYWASRDGCGAVCCIGGWVEGRLKQTLRPSFFEHAHLLFYPDNIMNYNKVTPKQAARAIDNYLKHGEPRWKTDGEGI
jgi:hypothetical protein